VDVVEDFPPAHVADAQLVISELVTNAIQHAGLEAEEGIAVSMQREGDRYRIAVDDHGSFTARSGDKLPGGPRGGRGLAIVDALCVSWEARAGLVVAWIAI
jgi:anti-sigma regulatory factor (Ser/Thr protein kinase)